MSKIWYKLSSAIISRKGAWATIAIAAIFAALVMGLSGQSGSSGGADSLPPDSESAQTQKLLEKFPGGDRAPAIAVFSGDGDELSKSDLAAAGRIGDRLGDQVDGKVSPPIPAPDGEAAIVNVPVATDLSSSENVDTIESLRSEVSKADVPDGLEVQVTGGPAFGADIASSFDGANFLLLAVTVSIVAVLLIITYRSPILWLIPLGVVGVADQLATTVDGQLADWFGLQFDSGIISVLVFGAGTNYALLLISRYREELRRTDDHRTGLLRALRAAAPAILASNLTVVLALLTLVLATVPSTSGLGVAAAAGLIIALIFGLLVLPAALAVCGRRLFWPFIPRNGEEERSQSGIWSKVANTVVRRPTVVVGAAVVVLAVLAAGLFGAQLGLSQTEQFRVGAESVDGFDTLSEHFPAGSSEPATIVANTSKADAVAKVASGVDGVVRAEVVGTSPSGLTEINATLDASPGTDASYDAVRDLRGAVHDVSGADAVVGGQVAQDLDTRDASIHDIKLIVPLVLGVVFVVLTVLLRALVAPVVLVALNVLSALAAIGAGTWVGANVFDFPALDVNVPLLAFLFLVALGIDYTIFLVTRAREETPEYGTITGMTRAVTATGGVITSAGIVLAGVFAALGVLPLMTLAQLGLIVGLGVLIDTLLVRTVMVPALFAMVGLRMWWPGKLAARDR
jgi:RND superfamily putative drug exporter